MRESSEARSSAPEVPRPPSKTGKPAQPFYLRLYFHKHRTDLVRLVGYDGAPLDDFYARLQPLKESHGEAATLTGANRNDVTGLLPAVDAIPPVRGKAGRPRRRPLRPYADRGYDSGPHRQELRRRHATPVIARRNAGHGSGLGGVRWIVERTPGWFRQLRRLGTRYDRDPERHEALTALACSLIRLRFC